MYKTLTNPYDRCNEYLSKNDPLKGLGYTYTYITIYKEGKRLTYCIEKNKYVKEAIQ